MDIFQSIFSNFPFVSVLLALIALFYWLWTFITIYHLIRFGIGTRPKLLALVFFTGSMVLFMITISAFNQISLGEFSLKNFNIDTIIKLPESPLPTFNQ